MDIAVHNLTKTFGTLRANDAISLSFGAGQIHGVLGENGAGKSTLMKVLSGFLRADAGEILLDGRPLRLDSPAAALRAGIGMVHQDPLDIPAFTVLEDFFCASPRQALPNRAVARRTLLELAERLGFAVAPDLPVASLTVGQRQQLAILRLLAYNARVFILDEPTTGISAAQVDTLFAALRRLAAAGNTVIFVSHKLDEVAELCQTVSVLRGGRVMGPGQMVMPQPQERLLELMFGADLNRAAAPKRVIAPASSTPDAPAPAAYVWELEHVTLSAGKLALHDLNLRIPAGTIWGLAGLEGSGQQALLQLLAGHRHPAGGCLRLAGADVTGQATAAFLRMGVQYLPADRLAEGMVGALSLADHFALQDQQAGLWVDRRAADEAARAAIAAYAIKATPSTPIAALSGGNQQRAMLALLPPQCRGLLLDQPTRGLDLASARGVWQRLLERRNTGTALVFASADLDELLDYSDYVLVFFAGQISAPLPRAELHASRLGELIGGVGFST